jgi:hypothetical protein
MVPSTDQSIRYHLDSTPPAGGVFRASNQAPADEKIPPPVVEVNNKPQYLVFSLHFLRPPWSLVIEMLQN